MFKLKYPLLILLITSSIFTSCKDDAELIVDITSISLSEDNTSQQILITNAGDKDLEWTISSNAEWVIFSNESGTLSTGSTSVMIGASTAIAPGDYSATITIASNGGGANVSVSLTVIDKIAIFPGDGLVQVELGDDSKEIRENIGQPGNIYHTLLDEVQKVYVHEYSYFELGISCFFLNQSKNQIADNDEAFYFMVYEPFFGETVDSIGLSSSLSDVQNLYGITEEVYEYTNQGFLLEDHLYGLDGIGFTFFKDDTSEALFVHVFNPYNPQNDKVHSFIHKINF
jgi:hypothetical protein